MHRRQSPSIKGSSMAVEPATTDHSAEIANHARDYSGFIKLFKYGAIISFVTAMIILVIISN